MDKLMKMKIDDNLKSLVTSLNENVTLEGAGTYIKQGLEEDFIELTRESKDTNFFVAHICMLHLATHLITREESDKETPKESFRKACAQFPPSINETMIKTLVTQFSIRGREFGDWVEDPEKWETLWEIEK